MRKYCLISITTLAMAMFASQASQAQVNPAFAEISEAVEQARSIVQTERKLLVMQNLNLLPAESAAFWKVYDEYAADLKKVGDRRVKVVTDFAANYDTMTDATADQLTKEYLDYQDKLLGIRRSYYKKFNKAVGATKAARFYQIENKLDAITNFALARQIPLVPQKAGTAPMPKP